MRLPPRLSEFHRYPVTAGTALLAIGVTVAWWLNADISRIFVDAMVRRGELWRLLTSILPHGGILHLAFNVYWLWVFGTLIEEVFGHVRTAALIVVLAIASSAWEFAILSGGIGLSGVGYGLFGLLWMLSRRDERFSDAVDDRTIQLFVIWFFFCVATTVMGVLRVANIAHASGLIMGMLIGLAIARPDQRALFASGAAAVLMVGLWGVTLGRPRINLSKEGGFEEASWGYEALVANKNDEAARWFRDALMYQPKNGSIAYDLGLAYERAGNNSAALDVYRRAADLGNVGAQYRLATLYAKGSPATPKDSAQALYWYGKSVQQNDPDVLNDVAWAFATSSDPAIRNPKAALEYAAKAVSLDKGQPNPNHLDTLAEAYYASGDAEQAVTTEQRALELAPAEQKNEFEQHLEKYKVAHQRGKPSVSNGMGKAE